MSEDLSGQADQPAKDLAGVDHLRSLDETPPQSDSCHPSGDSDAIQRQSNVKLSSDSVGPFLSNPDDADGSVISEVNVDRREAEINAAVRSLKTNLILCATYVITASMFAVMPDIANVVIGSVIKGVTPIVTALVNFGKLQGVSKLYWENALRGFRNGCQQPRP